MRHAVRGFQHALRTENSFRIHVTVASLVVVALIVLPLNPLAKAIIIFVMSNILVVELVNTVVERFVGLLEPRVHPYVGVIKDLMAAAVLVLTVSALLIGLVLFSTLFPGSNT